MHSIGIDLGTTNSVASHIQAGRPAVILNRDEQALTPSVVGYRPGQGGGYLIGIEALRYAEQAPADTIYSIKRLMGLDFDDVRVQQVRSRVPYAIRPAPDGDGDVGVRVMIAGRPHTPIDVSAMILRRIKDDCSRKLGGPVDGATITVPAYFQECQRNATRAAGEAAGLTLRPLLDEPVAAALAFGMGEQNDRHRVLVYDLGGGTFDVSIVQLAGDNIQALGVKGDMWLGGDDFDHVIARRIFDYLASRYGLADFTDPLALRRIKLHSEAAKKALSAAEEYQVLEPLLFKHPEKGPLSIDLTIHRDEFEAAIRPQIERSLALFEESMDAASLKAENLTAVVLAGGSTRIPLVRRMLAERFGVEKVRHDVDPMQCVSLGAALWNARFPMDSSGRISLKKLDQTGLSTPMDVGIEIYRDGNPRSFAVIIPRDTAYPMSKPIQRTFLPTVENQRKILIPMYQGNSALTTYNNCQGVIDYELPKGIPARTKITVGISIDVHGTLTVEVNILGFSDYSRAETIKRNQPTLSKEVQEQLARWKDDLRDSIQSANRFLKDYSTYFTAEDRKVLEDLIRRGEAALKDGDRPEGQTIRRGLTLAIFGSSTASVLYLSRRAMELSDAATAQKIARTKVALEEAHESGRADRVRELSDELKPFLSQVFGGGTKPTGPGAGQLTSAESS